MKILLVTIFNTRNCGAALQAYASYKLLENFGNVTLLNYSPSNIDPLIQNKKSLKLKPFVKSLIDFFLYKNKKIFNNNFVNFIYENFNLTKPIFLKKDFDSIVNNYDVICYGSDQIFNYKIVGKKSLFIPTNRKDLIKFSLASSCGGITSLEQELINNINNLNGLSVRDLHSFKLLNNFYKNDINIVEDPTLLINSDFFYRFIINNKHGKYYFIYIVQCDDNMIDFTMDLLNKYEDKKFIVVCQSYKLIRKLNSLKNRNVEIYKFVDPISFINLIYHSFAVVTDSFHGICFSSIFNKKLLISRPSINYQRIDHIVREHKKLNNNIHRKNEIKFKQARLEETQIKNSRVKANIYISKLIAEIK